MEEKKVSVLIAIYNVEKYIAKCIDSVIKQDYKNLEIILVDDCSTDSSPKICDEYVKKDPRIRVIHHSRNKKLYGARNTGIKNATGDFIMFVDGDDWLAEDCVSFFVDLITKTDTNMAINLVNFTTRDTIQVAPNPYKIWSDEEATATLLYSRISIGAWNKIYRKDFIEHNKLTFKRLFTAEGFRFISDCSQRASKIGVGYRKVYYYRLNNSESATTKYDIRQSLSAISAAEDIKRDLVIKSPSVINSINHHIWYNHFWNIRQINALKNKKEYLTEYRNSIKYLKQNSLEVAKNDISIKAKIKDIIIYMAPNLFAKYINHKSDKLLRQDSIK